MYGAEENTAGALWNAPPPHMRVCLRPHMYLLLHEEFIDGLLFSHELDNQSVQVDEQGSTESTGDAAETETNRTADVTLFHVWHQTALGAIEPKVKRNKVVRV